MLAKSIGLGRGRKKMLEFKPFQKGINPAALLYRGSLGFYKSFCATFGDGCIVVSGLEVPSLENLNASLVLFHLAVELMLKSLLALRDGELKDSHRNHNIDDLLNDLLSAYPKLVEISTSKQYMLVLVELSNFYNAIRYCEGTICLRHNEKKSSVKPLQEFSAALHHIYQLLCECFIVKTRCS